MANRPFMMSRSGRTVALCVAILTAVAGGAAALVGPTAADGEWSCPPCGCADDGNAHAAPGSCAACGMKRIRKQQVQEVAILLFDGVQIIDFTGPYEVFGQAGFRVYTVTADGGAITTAMGMKVTPTHSFESAPQPTILLVPGGNAAKAYGDERTITWVGARAAEAQHVLSVCNGAFILARAGLLDGLKATTFYSLLDDLAGFAPRVEVVKDERFVDNGRIVTSAGLTSGIDATLYLVSKILGRGEAQRIALHLEYDWDPEGGFARGALAHRLIPRLREPDGAYALLAATEGSRDAWEERYDIRTSLSPSQLLAHTDATLEKLENWTRSGPAGASVGTRSTWSVTDEQGRPWAGEASVSLGEAGALQVSIRISRGALGAVSPAR